MTIIITYLSLKVNGSTLHYNKQNAHHRGR
jgi:hypothetical protein